MMIFVCASLSQAAAQTIRLPITVDYPLLRNLLVDQAFPEKNETVTLLNEGGGCIHLDLASPKVSEAGSTVRLEMKVSAMAATPFGGECFSPLEWQGYLVLYQKPAIATDNWQISFTTVKSQLLGANRQPAQIADMLWKLIEPHISAYINDIRIHLMPPVNELKNFILPLYPQEKQDEARRMLASMRPSEINVEADALRLAILAEVESVYEHDEGRQQQEFDEQALRKTVTVWEQWDGLLVYLITTLSKEMLSDEEKRTLTNALLDTRYRFVTELSDRTIPHDIVRQQFVSVWQKLSPIFRKHLLQDSQSSMALGYIAFVTSADALLVFDRLGPTFGLEISTNGLIRLANMLHADPALLQYRSDINTELQKLFQIEPESTLPAAPGRSDKNDQSMLDRLLSPLCATSAYADNSAPSFQDILQWQVPKSDVRDYLRRVEKILASSSSAIIEKGKVPKEAQAMFLKLIPAMAWQESCFRQFVVKGGQLTYLLSYNGTSVGLMQINERIWRGLYDLNRLRWDIGYNAVAGCEIAALYLSKYALRGNSSGSKLDDDTLARLVYAMYNGGPSQQSKFMNRLQNNKFYDSDKLFWEKFSLVTKGEVDKVSICLIGS